MDKSPEYVKMCEKATEIQKLGVQDSFYALPFFTPMAISLYHLDNDEQRWVYGDYYEDEHRDEAIWLPRQDQLQKIVGKPIEELWQGIVEFAGNMVDEYEWLKSKYYHYSMEQLWLAFVMKELYSKVWNGSDWVTSQLPQV